MGVFGRASAAHGFCGVILLAVCWLPYCIALSPGSINYDTTGQIVQFVSLLENGDYPLSVHHPVFDTLVFGVFFCIGDAFVGDMRAGLQVLIILQAVITAVAISWSIVRAVVSWGTPRSLAVVLFLLVALLPMFPLAVCSLSKDTFFSWLYVLFFTMVVDLAVRGHALLRKPPFFLGLVAVCVLMGLTKKFGIYVVVGTLAVSVLCVPKTRSNVIRLGMPAIVAALTVFLVMPRWSRGLAAFREGSRRRYRFLCNRRHFRTFGMRIAWQKKKSAPSTLCWNAIRWQSATTRLSPIP